MWSSTTPSYPYVPEKKNHMGKNYFFVLNAGSLIASGFFD
jgi:hypothetical protein